jgi:hypothetical protein
MPNEFWFLETDKTGFVIGVAERGRQKLVREDSRTRCKEAKGYTLPSVVVYHTGGHYRERLCVAHSL